MKPFFSLLLLALPLLATAQDCCAKIPADGRTLYDAGEYALAKVKFELAKSACACPGMDSWIAKCDAALRGLSDYTETVNDVSFKMVAIPGGTFSMGSKDYDSEKPVHTATVSSFYAGETEVTQALWRAVMGTTVPQQRDKLEDPSWPLRGEGDAYPMYYISWEEAQTFIQKLNTLTGKRYRLPTEAEWEYAAGGGNGSRTKWAGTSTESSFGSYAWYNANSDSKTHPVKSKSPNALGLYDMSGNVWEWCQDWYGTYPTSSSAGYSGPSTGSSRVYRGGSWLNDPAGCRVALRGHGSPSDRDYILGFRLALSW